ncbi:hypothetical protein [Pseudomonas sp. Fl4BN1]|uniref:hypothetical protein n=1 Tax=Pseudomonas sp. Fl4BN1 TaxID=2697651 RepID=UPI00355742CA
MLAKTYQSCRDSRPRLEAERVLNTRVLISSNDCIKVLDLDGRLSFISEGGQRGMEVRDFNAIVSAVPGRIPGEGRATRRRWQPWS